MGILYFLTQIRRSTLDVARDADIEVPTSRSLHVRDFIGNRASLAMDIIIRLITFHFCPIPSIVTSLMTLITSEAPIAFLVGIVCV